MSKDGLKMVYARKDESGCKFVLDQNLGHVEANSFDRAETVMQPYCNWSVFWTSKCWSNPTSGLQELHYPLAKVLGALRKTRRQRQRERHETKGLISKRVAVYVRYKSWYIAFLQVPESFVFLVTWD